MLVSRAETQSRLALHVSPVHEACGEPGRARIGALVLALDPARRRDIEPARIADLLGLAPAESRLANLTLSGDATNAVMGANGFAAKREVYRKSSIGMTRSVAGESAWHEAALEPRVEELVRRVVRRWPWPEQLSPAHDDLGRSSRISWRIGDEPWCAEDSASQMVLNVAAELLTRDPASAERLSGEAISSNVRPASRYPPGTTAGTLTMRAVPGHEDYVLYPYAQDYATSAARCRKMGERCGVTVEVEFDDISRTRAFWRFVKDHTGGVPGQKDSWRGASQWSSRGDASREYVGIYVGIPELLWLYIKSKESEASEERAARIRRYSWLIRDEMGDQQLGDNLDRNSENGMTIAVQRPWLRDDEEEWPYAARWISEQCERPHTIIRREPGDES